MMPCVPIPGGYVCGPGEYTHLVLAPCPWCCLGEDETVHAFREVHSGYCAPDMICGTCGQEWNGDADRLRKMREDERLEAIGRVGQMAAAGVVVGLYPKPEGA